MYSCAKDTAPSIDSDNAAQTQEESSPTPSESTPSPTATMSCDCAACSHEDGFEIIIASETASRSSKRSSSLFRTLGTPVVLNIELIYVSTTSTFWTRETLFLQKSETMQMLYLVEEVDRLASRRINWQIFKK